MNTTVLFSASRDDWATPQGLFDVMHRALAFTLDVAANAQNAKADRWLGPGSWLHENGLTYSWANERCWMNPPYSQARAFVHKARQESLLRGAMVCALLPARTDTRWWHEHIWDERKGQCYLGVSIFFRRGRIRFDGAKNGAPFPSVFVIFEPPCTYMADHLRAEHAG